MTNKLAGISPGDRVRVTFEGKWIGLSDGTFDVSADGCPDLAVVCFSDGELAAPTFKIEKLATPLKVGRARDAGLEECKVLMIYGDQCVVKYSDNKWLAVMPTEGMENINE